MLSIFASKLSLNVVFSLKAIPGGADRALTPTARLRLLVAWSAALGGLTAGLLVAYRTLLRPGGLLGPWGSSWVGLLAGRREL